MEIEKVQQVKQIQRITKNMMIGEVVYDHPEAAEVLLSYGVHCVGCHVSFVETLEQGLKAHARLSDEEVEKAITEINEAITIASSAVTGKK